MATRILQGNVFDMLPTIKLGSVDCCVTSPPYWGLRSYLPQGHALKHLELGSEKTSAEYIDNQVRVFALVKTVLADHGTVWLNVGDSYTHTAGKRKTTDKYGAKQRTNGYAATVGNASDPSIDEGNLCLIPQRLALALQDDGWVVRSEIVWRKPACMPSSVAGWRWQRCRVKVKSPEPPKQACRTANARNGASRDCDNDGTFIGGGLWSECLGCKKCSVTDGWVLRRGSWRPTSSWEPVWMLAKKTGYYADGDAVRTPSAATTLSRNRYSRVIDDPDEQFAVKHDHETTGSGANLRDVWRTDLEALSKGELISLVEELAGADMADVLDIAAQPLAEAHFAAFPEDLVRRCLMAGTSSRGYCPACGKPWARMVEPIRENGLAEKGFCKTDQIEDKQNAHQRIHRRIAAARAAGEDHDNPLGGNKTVGWRQSCKCSPAEPRAALVLDPFSGSGRTAIACQRLGLDCVGCELNPEYVAMSERLIRGNMPLFAEEV